ncbi:MAG: ATP-binding protein [Owenweeksia sp.]|nr:ATP-binding protein [Owenweeksia sp.]
MRHLNKIIFINSATIRYEEVMLDGNVHFIGTQGVGKSTVLRAILFFYNGDTQKLGIPREKKIFAEYYFPNTNSYIVYEVQRETGPFTVLVMRSGSGVVFRFIDAPYDREWMMRDMQPLERWGDIRQELDQRGIDSSNRIDRLIDYRDIIYGNPAVPPAHRKYSLIESKQYQNIPRTITNVFLNTKLEASFIKETIIHSLSEEELLIDLMAYRHHLHDFEKEYEDIQTFLQPKTQEQAEKIIRHFNRSRQRKADQLRSAARLSASLSLAEKELEVQKRELQKANQQKAEKQQKQEEGEKRQINQISLIRGNIKSVEGKIREAQKKDREYREKDIGTVMERYQREQEWKNTAQQIKSERTTLTAKFDSIEQQFQVLRQQLQNKMEQLKNSEKQQQQEVQQEFLEQKEALGQERDKQLQSLQEIQEEKIEALQKQVEEYRNQLSNLREEKISLAGKHWRAEEIQQLKDLINKTKNEASAATHQIKTAKESRENLRGEWQRKEEKRKEQKDRDYQQLQRQKENLEKQLSDIELKLSRHQHALYGYLQEHYPDWRETIGRVAREDVLFNENLEPMLHQINEIFFGLELNLDGLEISAKSLEQYELEKKRLKEQLEELKKEISLLEVNLKDDLDRLTKRFKPKVREISDEIQRLEVGQQQKQSQAERDKIRLEELQHSAAEEKAEALESVEQQINGATARFQDQQNLVDQQKQTWQKEQQKIRTATAKKIKKWEKDRDEKRKAIALRFEAEFRETEQEEAQLKQQQTQKLKAAGADTRQLNKLDEKLSQVNAELRFIEENRELVIEYRKDKRELIDRTEEFKGQREKEAQKLERAETRLEEMKRKHKAELAEINKAIHERDEQIRKLEDGFEEFKQFSGSEIYAAIEKHMQSAGEAGDAYAVKKSIQELRDISHELQTLRENLRDATNRFLSRFTDANLFHFPTQPATTEEYLHFAADLKEFIDENKISEFERRVNERFANILHSVSKETGDLISREGDIQKVVTNINRDFRERNFVGVIQSMELKVEDSANRVVNTLKRIRDYEQESGFDLGEKNLFNLESGEGQNKRAVEFLRQLNRDMQEAKRDKVSLSDAFELRFRVVENENDSGWVEKLSHVGSEGTDVLVKAMINILLLNVFKESASRKFKDFRLHCMMDEVGRLHPTNVRGILKFANDRNIMLINGSPVEQDAMAYRHIYELRKDSESRTRIKRLVTVRQADETTI